jgi:hypothetical protein
MSTWTSEELSKIGTADELSLQSQRNDGTLREPVTIWVIRQGDDLYVRPVKGPEGWYRGTRSKHQGHIRAGGISKNVAFADADADQPLNNAIDTAYQAKYRSYPPSVVAGVLSAAAKSGTLRLMPR